MTAHDPDSEVLASAMLSTEFDGFFREHHPAMVRALSLALGDDGADLTHHVVGSTAVEDGGVVIYTSSTDQFPVYEGSPVGGLTATYVSPDGSTATDLPIDAAAFPWIAPAGPGAHLVNIPDDASMGDGVSEQLLYLASSTGVEVLKLDPVPRPPDQEWNTWFQVGAVSDDQVLLFTGTEWVLRPLR